MKLSFYFLIFSNFFSLAQTMEPNQPFSIANFLENLMKRRPLNVERNDIKELIQRTDDTTEMTDADLIVFKKLVEIDELILEKPAPIILGCLLCTTHKKLNSPIYHEIESKIDTAIRHSLIPKDTYYEMFDRLIAEALKLDPMQSDC